MRGFARAIIAVIAISCGGQDSASDSSAEGDQTVARSTTPDHRSTGAASALSASGSTTPATLLTSSLAATGSAEPSPCEGFERRYLGQGVSAALPADTSAAFGESTADIGPIYAGWAVQFELSGGSVMIGRRVGTTIVREPNFSQRVDGDVVVFVRSENEPLRTCVLDTATYDRGLDEEDG